jgi:hypothetical protein
LVFGDSIRREQLSADAKQCEQRCPARSRLFEHRNPGEDADAMADLQGRPYRGRHRAYTEAATKKLNGKTADSRPVAMPEGNHRF